MQCRPADEEPTAREGWLVERARSGDLDAFEVLVRRYDRQLRAYVSALLGFPRKWDLDDILQDVYLKAFRSIGSFRGEASVRAWLSAIARTTCAERRRRCARCRTLELTDSRADVVESTSAPLADQVEARELVIKALRRLKEPERVAIFLAYYLDLPQGQIAEMLGERLGTVASRLCRARARLRGILLGPLEEPKKAVPAPAVSTANRAAKSVNGLAHPPLPAPASSEAPTLAVTGLDRPPVLPNSPTNRADVGERS